MVAWHHWLNGHEFEQTPGDSEGQGSLAGCSPWGHKESDMTEQPEQQQSKTIQILPKTLPAAVAAAKSLQSCLTLCNPRDGSPPGSPPLGFSRQEHWSGLPFPSPMHESEKLKWSCSVVSDSWWPHGLQPTRLLRPWDFPGKSTGVGVPLPSPKLYLGLVYYRIPWWFRG